MAKQERVERKLAAILAADVVGYSRLMGADEVGTLRALKAARKELIDPAIAAHGGRIVKTTGDGLLVDFASVVDAVTCAVAIQRKMSERNEGVAEAKHLVLRIGVNIGDIIIDGKDIFGDGVNIAARLESICEPGGLCISDIARDQVRDKLPLAFTDGGEQQVKNIARPVRVFALSPQAIAEAPEMPAGGTVAAKPNKTGILAGAAALVLILAAGGGWWATHHTASSSSPAAPAQSAEARPTIAVLPLVSLSDDKQDYFADGLTEDISRHWADSPSSSYARATRSSPTRARRRSPKRSAATSTCAISSTAASAAARNAFASPSDSAPRPAAHSCGRKITTSRRRTSSRCRTTLPAALPARSPASSAIWSSPRPRPSRRAAWKSMTWSCAAATWRHVLIVPPIRRRARCSSAPSISTPTMRPPTSASVASSLTACCKAGQRIQKPPCSAPKILAARRSMLDPASAEAHALLGSTYIRYADYDRALDEMRRAVELNNSDAVSYAGLATALLWSGDVDASVKDFETAAKLGLNFTANESFILGLAYLLVDRNADAIRILERSLERNRTDPYTNAVLAAAYAQAGRQEDAERQAQALKAIAPRFDSTDFGSLFRKGAQREKIAAAMSKAGL